MRVTTGVNKAWNWKREQKCLVVSSGETKEIKDEEKQLMEKRMRVERAAATEHTLMDDGAQQVASNSTACMSVSFFSHLYIETFYA